MLPFADLIIEVCYFGVVTAPRKTECPTCKKEGDWLSGKYAPFCSHRCKLIDLGKWLGEEHRISSPLRDEQGAEAEKDTRSSECSPEEE